MGKPRTADERAVAALTENPFLSIAGIMRAAKCCSGAAIRALRENPPPPRETGHAPNLDHAKPPPIASQYC
jgi:hypothetical protein